MLVPANEIEKFNIWTRMCVDLVGPDCEKRRLQRVLYSLPFQCAFDADLHEKALKSAQACPDVPLSAYKSFKSFQHW